MDTMTYLALKATGLPKKRIIGMGGILDSSRFKYYLSQALNCAPNDLQGVVIGGHGDTTMIPLTRLATYSGVPVSNYISADVLKKVAADTMVGGATLTGLLGTSAWYAPGAAGIPGGIGATLENLTRTSSTGATVAPAGSSGRCCCRAGSASTTSRRRWPTARSS